MASGEAITKRPWLTESNLEVPIVRVVATLQKIRPVRKPFDSPADSGDESVLPSGGNPNLCACVRGSFASREVAS